MDVRTGKIMSAELFTKLKATKADTGHLIEMKLPPTQKQLLRVPPRVGRNEPCPCGSGKKFKHCHLQP